IGAMIMVFSCSKQETKMEPDNSKNFTPYEMQVNKTIKDFKQTIVYYHETPDFKSGESVSADSALWLLEATINYSHAFPNEYYEEMQTNDLTLTVPKNIDGTVDMDMVIQKYDEMKGDITTVYNGVSYGDKGLVLVDLSETSQTAAEIVMNVQMVAGDKGNDPPPDPGINGPFEEEDDWWYGEFKGHCPPHTWDSDASIELKNAMNDYISEQNNGVFFIHQTEKTKKGGDPNIRRPGDPNPPDNDFDYYLYSSSTENETVTDETLCLEWTEMNIYYTYLKYLLFTKMPNDDVPEGYAVETILSMEGTYEWQDIYKHYFHEGIFKFGFPVGYGEGEGPEEL
ncbi:MAG: hypothetical protein K8S16_06485, partial [Bacteroidales bacterium]|nr:hypothetical protein [Bacteroidales bacterium]